LLYKLRTSLNARNQATGWMYDRVYGVFSTPA